MPAVSGVRLHPSVANQPGSPSRYTATSAGPHPADAATCWSSPSRSAPRHAAPGDRPGPGRCGADRPGTTPGRRRPICQWRASSSHSRRGGAGSRCPTGRGSASSGRSSAWCMATTGAGDVVAAVGGEAVEEPGRRDCRWRRRPRAAARPQLRLHAAMARPATAPARPAASSATAARKATGHTTRQGVTREGRVLERQMERQVRRS